MSGLPRILSFIFIGLLILESRRCSELEDSAKGDWWKTTLVYQIWPRSFQDSDGDGIGDLQGIINRLDYLDALDIETICLNPIFPSPYEHVGFDVSNHTDVDSALGNLEDFDELIAAAHERGMKVILDFVPNHTSDKHEWFEASIRQIDPYTDYYVWQNGSVDDNGTKLPPNNLTSLWNGEAIPAWAYNDVRDQWYYHIFGPTEPDLNLENDNVQEELGYIVNFWLEKGVDGFRIRGHPYLYENLGPQDDLCVLKEECLYHHDKNVLFLFKMREFIDYWTDVNNSTSKFVIAGSYDTDENLQHFFADPNRTGVVLLNYRFISSDDIGRSNATKVANLIENWLHIVPTNDSTNWALTYDGSPRIASRVPKARLDALFMLNMLLPGQSFAYYGDEIGMSNTFNANSDSNPSMYLARGIMQWDSSVSAGFSNNSSPYIPVNENYEERNVEAQLNDTQSHLNVFKRLAVLRKNPVFTDGDWELETLNEDTVLVLRRTLADHPVYIIVINFLSTTQSVNITQLYPDLDDLLDVVVTSGTDDPLRAPVQRDDFWLLPNTGIVLKSDDDDELPIVTSFNDPEEETTDAAMSSTTEIPETIESTSTESDNETTNDSEIAEDERTNETDSNIAESEESPPPDSAAIQINSNALLSIGFAISIVVIAQQH